MKNIGLGWEGSGQILARAALGQPAGCKITTAAAAKTPPRGLHPDGYEQRWKPSSVGPLGQAHKLESYEARPCSRQIICFCDYCAQSSAHGQKENGLPYYGTRLASDDGAERLHPNTPRVRLICYK